MQNVTADKGSLLVVSRQEVSSWANATFDKDVTLVVYPDHSTPEQIAMLIKAATQKSLPEEGITSWNMPPTALQPNVPIFDFSDYQDEDDEEEVDE